MLLLFGTRLRRRSLGAGTFDCPYCAAPREYERVGSRTWAHMFWIPILPVGGERVSILCTRCEGEWSPRASA